MVPFPLGAVNTTEAVVLETVAVPMAGAPGFVKTEIEDDCTDDLNIPLAVNFNAG